MFCCLSLTSLLLVQRISAMFHRTRRQHKAIKALLILGSLLITLTGAFPERYGAPPPAAKTTARESERARERERESERESERD
jgi:hypothetical membrane protein